MNISTNLEPGVAGEQRVGASLVHGPDPLAVQIVGDLLQPSM